MDFAMNLFLSHLFHSIVDANTFLWLKLFVFLFSFPTPVKGLTFLGNFNAGIVPRFFREKPSWELGQKLG